MRLFYPLYTVLFSILFVVLLPVFWFYMLITGRYAGHFGERLGFVPKDVCKNPSGHLRIWVHAVSLGEVKVAAAIINAVRHIRPDCSIVVSTTTESGRNMARETFGNEIPHTVTSSITKCAPVSSS